MAMVTEFKVEFDCRNGFLFFQGSSPRTGYDDSCAPKRLLPRYTITERNRGNDGVPPARPPPEIQNDLATGNVLVVKKPKKSTNSELILYMNDFIGYHRFMFSANRFPALISVIVSLWILSGAEVETSEQKRLTSMALILAAWILLGQLYALHNHCNSHRAAFIQTTFRVIHLCVDIPLSVAVILCASASINSSAFCDDNDLVLLAMSLIILTLSTAALLFGIFACRVLYVNAKSLE
ncbi:unnamed protein product [Anisakis simplex]|uniref:Neur_chan_memb domain-containing protein n=1 Tax=Anisakis simplex TaxID=6269 RepID=A0A0M3K158_ANISI|nr:unnamed protein product [Anisakis simplex]